MAVAGPDGIHPRVGFIGLGRMGEPMAVRLVRAGTPLTVWSRTPASVRRVADVGATPAADAVAVFAASDVVLLMLANGEAVDAVLGRSADGFGVPVEGRLVVSTGTVAPEHSRALAAELARHGARFVEAPVSGSRVPAQHGQLVAMLAGDEADVEEVRRLVAPLASAVFACGPVPRALETKLAVNVFLIAMVTGLAESVAFAEGRGVDRDVLRAVLDAGPMASAVSTLKLAKLVDGDLAAQAAVSDVLYNNRLILDAGGAQRLPLMAAAASLYERAEALGFGRSDMIAVIEALREAGAEPGAT